MARAHPGYRSVGMAILHEWRFCPRCAADARSRARPRARQCPACGFVGYANSSPCVVRGRRGRGGQGAPRPPRDRRRTVGSGTLPAAISRRASTRSTASERELLEETGLTVEPERFLGVLMDWYGEAPDANATLNLFWTARIVAGDPVAADDVAELRWFGPDELPPTDELAFTLLPVGLRGLAGAMNVVFLFDVDNTLLDNDRVAADLRVHLDDGRRRGLRPPVLAALRGAARRARLRRLPRRPAALPGRAARATSASSPSRTSSSPTRSRTGSSRARSTRSTTARTIGATAILSDGDVVFQPRKIRRSGLYDAVGGRVLVYIHKEHELDDVAARLPADHYVLVDDKVRILAAVKAAWGSASRRSGRGRGTTRSTSSTWPAIRPRTSRSSGSATSSSTTSTGSVARCGSSDLERRRAGAMAGSSEGREGREGSVRR